jgi:hypothetical protein
MSFRPAVEADYLESALRERVLSTLPHREFKLELITQELEPSGIKRLTLTDMHNPLVEWQEEEAIHHWKLMREVLPAVYWETY